MCDTLGSISNGVSFFAKNSDRSPNEPQVLEFHPAATPSEAHLQTTYLTIDQAEHTHACLLSRPTWMWGAEMGVNEFGLCIGNEAVFTKGRYNKTGLTGMDLLRLALERCTNAVEARDLIIELLEKHGQGGNCGYDHNFFYDNAFLIMDRRHLFVLETAGKHWVYKSTKRASISNRLSIGLDGERYRNGEKVDFRRKFSDPLFTYFSGSASRHDLTCRALTSELSLPTIFKTLRQHAPDVREPLCQATLKSPCMHAGSPIGDHSTASLVIQLDEEIKVWFTGTSTPCISLFKPWKFGTDPLFPILTPNSVHNDAYWQEHERFHRGIIGKKLPSSFYPQRDELESSWLAASEGCQDWSQLTQRALTQEREFYALWQDLGSLPSCGSASFLRYWKKKNQALVASNPR